MSLRAPANEGHVVIAGDVTVRTAHGFEGAPGELGLFNADRARALLGAPGAPGGRAGTHALRLADGTALVLRPFHRGGLRARFANSSHLSSPDRWFEELDVTLELHKRGAPVPQPAFAIACRDAGGWLGGVATQRIDDSVSASEYLADSSLLSSQLGAASEACARAIRAFHDCGGRHRDLHAGNLLLDAKAERAWVIDLDRARLGDPPSPRRRARELARLARSIEKLGHAARLHGEPTTRFCQAYAGADSQLATAVAKAWRSERWAIAFHRLGY